jgi:hypothetical protein
MEIRLAGGPTNVEEAVCDVQRIHADAPAENTQADEISEPMRQYMLQLLQQGSSRALFLWLLKVTLDITAPAVWWRQGEEYFSEVRWVRKHPQVGGDRPHLRQEDFEGGVPGMLLDTLNELIQAGRRDLLDATLPENYVRRGYGQTDYAALRRLYLERGHYNSGHWHDLSRFLTTLPYAEFLTA